MNRWDAALALGVFLLAGALWLAPFGGGSAVELRGPHGHTSVDLDADGTYRVDGAIGVVVFEVEDGSMRCVRSTCPDGICVRMGAVAPGHPVVCAPNGVVARIDSLPGDLDAVSR